MNAILLISDDTVSLKSFRDILGPGGYAFFEVPGGREALSVLNDQKIDLILLDTTMPGTSGSDVLAQVKASPAHKNIPVIAIIAPHDFASIEQALTAGAHDYVVKPVTRKKARIQFCLKVRNLLSMKDCMDLLEHDLKSAQMLTLLDDVTCLFNYRYFKERLLEEFTRSKRYHRPLSLIMVDLDNLKTLNDEFGHQSGTLLISMIGSIIEKHSRSTDIPVRYGGDEFCIIVPEANLAEAAILAERLRAQIEEFGRGIDVVNTPVTASIGVVMQNDSGPFETEEALLQAADDACYEAKRLGRNRVCWHVDGKIVPAQNPE